MPMPDDFKKQCYALATNQPEEHAAAICAAVDAEDHEALDRALQDAADAADRRIDRLREVRLLQNKLMGVV